MKRSISLVTLSVAVLSLFLVQISYAERYTSSNYTIDASKVGDSFGGNTTGGSYKLTSSGGDSVIGQGSGGSYQLDSGYVAQLQNSMELSVQPSGLLAHYPLDETNGTLLRDHGADDLNAYAINGPTSTTGKVGGAWQFDGVDDKLNAANPSQMTTPTELTWSAWIYPTNVSKDQMFLSKQGANYLRLSGSKLLASFYDNGTQKTKTGTTTLTNNQWYHVVATFKAGELALYVNGNPDGSRADITGPLNFNTGSFEVGQWSDADKRTFVGKIDEVKLFSRALSANQVKAEYNAGEAGNTAGVSFATDITPGVSQMSGYDAIVNTDAINGYVLSVNQNQNLTSGGNSIPAVSGSIASPATWSEGTTKGLGFTLYGTNATAVDGKWSAGAAYAAFPGSATSIYTRNGQQSAKDVLNMRLRLDVATTQPTGTYTNVITTTGTISP